MKKVTFFVLPVCLILWFSHCKKNGSDKPTKTIVTTIAGIGEPGYLDATAAFWEYLYRRLTESAHPQNKLSLIYTVNK